MRTGRGCRGVNGVTAGVENDGRVEGGKPSFARVTEGVENDGTPEGANTRSG